MVPSCAAPIQLQGATIARELDGTFEFIEICATAAADIHDPQAASAVPAPASFLPAQVCIGYISINDATVTEVQSH
jgi:hypothetical protein